MTNGGHRLTKPGTTGRPAVSFREFLAWLKKGLGRELEGIDRVSAAELFSWGEEAGIPGGEMVKKVGEFSGIPFLRAIDAGDLDFQALPRPFCQSKLVVPVKSVGASQTLILSNPFEWELLDDLERSLPRGRKLAIVLAAPEAIRAALAGEEARTQDKSAGARTGEGSAPSSAVHPRGRVYDPRKDPGKDHPVARLAMDLLNRAIAAGVGELSLEPKRRGGVVARALIGGNLQDIQEMPDETGRMLVARFKSLSGMSVAMKRTPQKGRVSVHLRDSVYTLRLATSPTSAFENLTIRVLDLNRRPRGVAELGMAPDQAELLHELAKQPTGLVLFAGPMGSGKTTTAYALLSALEDSGRRLVSVEDPVEHRLAWADQKEVMDEDGATTDALLRAAMAEEPDILYLSEIGNLVSVSACMDFASAGHLVLTSLDSSNCATAVFRLESLGVTRSALAASLRGIVAQRLLKKLCPDCREVRALATRDASLLEAFTDDLPSETAHPAGCSSCRGTGYRGQEAVFEVIPVTPGMAEGLAGGEPLGECREAFRELGGRLIGDHAIQKVRDLVFPMDDVYREVLLEEVTPLREDALGVEDGGGRVVVTGAGEGEGVDLAAEQGTILVVEDDEDTRTLLDRILSVAGFRVIQASDGGEALLKLGREPIDLILSDVHMPSLDGLKLLEIVHQHRIGAPVLLLTAEPSPEVEARCLEMGAVDYLRKPIEKPVLLARIRRALGKSTE
jgi:type II secretory ATPase GspE/PulE/Tfp pilus assembly ATPase PilB-like protein/CheY-like chemotaxis protein